MSQRLYIHLILDADSSLCQINLDWNQVQHRTCMYINAVYYTTAPV